MTKTRTEARDLFFRRRLHPYCPVDGHSEMWMWQDFILGEGAYWIAYKCKRCGTEFAATIYEKEPEHANL